MHKFSTKLYEQASSARQAGAQGAEPGPGAGEGTSGAAEDVVDAEFEVKDEKKD